MIHIVVDFLCYYEVDTQIVGFSSYAEVAAAAAFAVAVVEEYLVDAGVVVDADAVGVVVDEVDADVGFGFDLGCGWKSSVSEVVGIFASKKQLHSAVKAAVSE